MRVLLLLLLLFGAACVERRLFIRSDPKGATVRVNGKVVGKTPAVWSFDHYGKVLVEVERDGHEPAERVVELTLPWYQYPVVDFFADVLWPARVRDDHGVDFELPPVGRLSEEEVDAEIAALTESARRFRSEALEEPEDLEK